MAQLIMRKRLYLNSYAFFAFACGSNTASGPDGQPSGQSIWESLEACGLTNEFRVTTSEPTSPGCGDWPATGENVRVIRDQDIVRIQAGSLDLALTEISGNCGFTAAGCQQSVNNFEENRYFAPTMTLSKSGDRVLLTASGFDAIGRYGLGVGACTAPAEFILEEIPQCDVLGEFVATRAADKQGTCDLAWQDGDVTVEYDDDNSHYSIEWAGRTAYNLDLDRANCTLRTSGNSVVVYNNAILTQEVAVSVVGGKLSGTVTESLDGPTLDDKTCVGATFTLNAERVAREVTAFDSVCADPRPAVCGDSVCEAGEGCNCADCACEGGQVCASDEVCRRACQLQNASEVCQSGERCGLLDDSAQPMAVRPGSETFCVPAGNKQLGEVCQRNSECTGGLLCHAPVGAWGGECAPFCQIGEACQNGRVCAPLGERNSTDQNYWIPDYNAAYACERVVGPGDDCFAARCPQGYVCQKSWVNDEPPTYACVTPS